MVDREQDDFNDEDDEIRAAELAREQVERRQRLVVALQKRKGKIVEDSTKVIREVQRK